MRLALISPRYGAEITHGAEHVCRLLAEQLVERHAVDVLTTCAQDSETWKNHYPEGADRVRGVLVRRFAASSARDTQVFQSLSNRIFTAAHSRAEELEWVRRSGSSSAGLVDFLKRQHRNYDALVFFSYWAGTTIHGISVAPERSILFPGATVHPALRLWTCQDAFHTAAAIGYGSGWERRVMHAYANRHRRAEEIVGVGVGAVHESRYPRIDEPLAEPEADDGLAAASPDIENPPSHLAGRGVLFRRRHRLYGRFALYGGPIDSNNGTEELIEYFDAYLSQHETGLADIRATEPLALVLMGVKMMNLPREPWLRSAGLLPDRNRLAALEAADVAFAPDPDDVLGERTLEALAAGTPVLATASSGAAVEHIRRSGGGLYYANKNEFVEAMRTVMSNDQLRDALGRSGRRYIQQYYRWDAVLGRFERLINRVKGR